MKQSDLYFKTVLAGLKLMKEGVDALAQQIERVITSVESAVSPPDVKAKKEAEAKPARKAPIKPKKPVPKKEKPASAVDTVLGIINKSEKGVDTATLIKKTGFEPKKIHNIIYRLKRQGKIKSEEKGVYLKA